jgi:predicted Zn-dependent peptidase
VNQNVTQSLQKKIHRQVLDNGMTVIAVENPAADIISARIFIKAGSRCEPREKAGLSHLVSAVMTKGTDRLSSLEIAEQVESVGASLSTDATPDYYLLSLKTVSADFAPMLQLCHDLLRYPSFPDAEVELEQRLTLQGIRSGLEQPFTIAYDQMRQAMYPDHPYACSILGREETVATLTRADLEAFHRSFFRPDRIVVSLAGRIAPEAATQLIQEVFGSWEAPTTAVDDPQFPPLTPNPRQMLVPQDTQQSIIMVGHLTNSVRGKDPQNPDPSDYAALKLLNTYLGNGLSSRLFVELREIRGLAYDVSAFYPTRLDPGPFVVYMGTAPENTPIAFNCLRSELERLCTTPLSPEELQAAKNKLLGQYALGKQTNAQIAQVFGWYEILGLGIEFDTRFNEEISGISAPIAQEVACRYFKAEPFVSLVGPEAFISQV